jgi:hypothetical protein
LNGSSALLIPICNQATHSAAAPRIPAKANGIPGRPHSETDGSFSNFRSGFGRRTEFRGRVTGWEVGERIAGESSLIESEQIAAAAHRDVARRPAADNGIDNTVGSPEKRPAAADWKFSGTRSAEVVVTWWTRSDDARTAGGQCHSSALGP